MGAYIINVPSTVDRIIYVHIDTNTGKTAVASQKMEDLTPYAAPDLERVRMEAYKQGWKDGKIEGQAGVQVCIKKIAEILQEMRENNE